MPSEQIKGTLLAVGATAASTALLVGGIVGYNQIQATSAANEQAILFNETHSVAKAADTLTGATGAFSDHCTVMYEGMRFTAGPMSFTTSNSSLRGRPAPPSRSANGLDWQWTNKTRISPVGVQPEFPDVVATTPQNVSTPEGRTQENLNAWYQQIWDSNFKVGRIGTGYAGSATPVGPQVLAAHCEWDVTLSSDADENNEGPTLNDDVTLDAVPVWDLTEEETAPWLTVDGEKAQVTVHGRAYHTADKPVKGNGIPAGAQLVGETTLDFTASGTKTATINKPSNLDGGYVTWVWSVEKNNQPGEWGKYLMNDTVSDGWAAENEVVELPKAPKPTPSVAAPTIEPSAAPTPSDVTPSPEPSTTTPAPSPSESQALPPAPATSSTPTTPTQADTPSSTPANPAQSTPATPKTPETQASLAHTGSVAAPLIEASVVMLAGGLTIAFRKRNTI